MDQESESDTIYNWWARNGPKGLLRELEELEKGRQAKTIKTVSITKISQNTEKCPGLQWKIIS